MPIQIMNQDQCKRAITQIGRVAGAIQQKIHLVAVSTLAHMRDHGDTTLATSLLDALPNGQRVKALAHWYEHFANGVAKFKQDKTSGKWICELSKKRASEDFDVAGAELVSFADLTAEKSVGKPFTVEQLVKKLKAWADEDGTFEDGTPKVEESARDIAAGLLAQIEGAKPRLKLVSNG
jgi:hypothetical protein